MAMADYALCDVCGGKAFYDADVTDLRYIGARGWEQIGIAVLCVDCNKTHTITITKKEPALEAIDGNY